MFIPFSPSIIILAVLALFVVIILFKTALVVPNKQAVVVERLGKFHAVLYAGFHILIPFFSYNGHLSIPANILSIVITLFALQKIQL